MRPCRIYRSIATRHPAHPLTIAVLSQCRLLFSFRYSFTITFGAVSLAPTPAFGDFTLEVKPQVDRQPARLNITALVNTEDAGCAIASDLIATGLCLQLERFSFSSRLGEWS